MRRNESAVRVVDVLSLISSRNYPLTITEIVQALGIPKSSTFEILYTLLKKNIIEIENENLKTLFWG